MKFLHLQLFELFQPNELIASHPLERRDSSRMLVVGSCIEDRHIRDFISYLKPGDVVVFNNSRVISARFEASGHEITLHTSVNEKDWWGLCKKFNKIKIGDVLTMEDGTNLKVLDKDEESGLLLHFDCDNVFNVLDKVGKMPLPPYMKREEESEDINRYQTVYAEPLGSMAAPTAGLHFTDELMAEIEKRGAKIVKITLHVGAVWKMGCAKDYPNSPAEGKDAILVNVQDCDMKLCFAKAHVALKEWLREHNGGY